MAGSTLIVPPLEEVFYRSFLYRYIAKPDFLSVPLNQFLPLPFLATAAVFGFSHNEWLAGILCGAAYQGLVIRKNRLGDAMTAHAITNFLLGLWVVWRGACILVNSREGRCVAIPEFWVGKMPTLPSDYFTSMLIWLRSSVLPSCCASLASAS